MKAIVFYKYGSPNVLKLEEVEKPTVAHDQVLIKVHASSINSLDWRLMRAAPFFLRLQTGLWNPQNNRLGVEAAGIVEEVGKDVKRFKPGDAVFGTCGLGAFAEYVATREQSLVLKPDNVTFEQAAATSLAATTALQGLRDAGEVQSGSTVLIHGASGGVGTFAVQFAKYFGTEVTGVCNTRHVEMVRALGADHIIDYTQEDFAKNGNRYDLIFAVNGNRSIFDYRRALKPTGRYVLAGGTGMRQMLQTMLLGRWLSKSGGKQMISMGIASINQQDLTFIQEQLTASQIAPVIDHCYSLDDLPAAMHYYEAVHPQGKVVIKVAEGD